MTNNEISEVISKGQQDGATLFRVANAVYKVSMTIISLIGLLGLVLTLVAFSSGGAAQGLAVLVVTVIVCCVGYAGTVLGTHGAKVLVHLLFANLAILERTKQ